MAAGNEITLLKAGIRKGRFGGKRKALKRKTCAPGGAQAVRP
ncbi:hypothetical protein P262_01753 [Cronobacter malonaticus]|uniref:Uncharacterized protein n=1 Tax=Cronobacter malonaticus TaxID=413503 RepID=V5TXJ2_9ENTR|nr:hypothetical protein P262_01753 [Cronobacter malonaticus]CCJ93498.1 hypothetical protein BN131_1171 [Cronobacter malonaticus 681]